jgi:AbiV family abortive infection protein
MAEDFLKGCKLSVENARHHLEVAKLCSRRKLYGIGNSHLILSSEECVKAFMLFAKHKKPNIKIQDFNKYFSDHKHKHSEILELEKEFYMMNKMLSFILDPVLKVYKKTDNLKTEDILKLRDKGVDSLILWLKSVVKKKGETGFDDSWFKSANNRKNLGFYVEYWKNGNWHSPSDIQKKEYMISYKLVSRLVDMSEKLDFLYDSPMTQEMFRMMEEKGIFD